jgi:tetratricopeptide (TPR) repeat protein
MKKYLILWLISAILISCGRKATNEVQPDLEAPLFEGLGNLHYPVSTNNAYAQRFFNQGLTLSYAFNHAEAKRSFREAARLDSTCAMAYWGWALVLGSNINAAMDPNDLREANEAVANAVKYAGAATEKEGELIDAITRRYPKDTVIDLTEYHENYSVAMRALYEKYPDDVEIATLFAESLMDKYPWNYWHKDGTAQPWTHEIITVIERAIALDERHPGANHLYIHITEASKEPEKAMASADLLRDLRPAAGHIVHMPSHTYIRTGRYHDGVLANEKATTADSSYITQCKAQGIYPIAYYPHNDHFLAACAFFSGESKKSIAGAFATHRHTQHDLIGLPGFGTLEHYALIPLYVLVRFGKWDEILAYHAPADSLIYSKTVYHFARGMAYLGKNSLDSAKKELAKLKPIAMDTSLKFITIWDINNCFDLGQIALHVLEGEIAAKEKKYQTAINHLKEAIKIEDALAYNEPPDWFFSIRHHLGAVLIDAGKYKEAQNLYEDDLETYPENGWALIGLYNALMKQNQAEDAEKVKSRFDTAWKYADFELTSSRIL